MHCSCWSLGVLAGIHIDWCITVECSTQQDLMLQLESTKLPFDTPDQGGERALLLCSVFQYWINLLANWPNIYLYFIWFKTIASLITEMEHTDIFVLRRINFLNTNTGTWICTPPSYRANCMPILTSLWLNFRKDKIRILWLKVTETEKHNKYTKSQ